MPVQIAMRFRICWTTGHADRQTRGTQTGSATGHPQRHHRICNLQGDQDVLRDVRKGWGVVTPSGKASRTAHAPDNCLAMHEDIRASIDGERCTSGRVVERLQIEACNRQAEGQFREGETTKSTQRRTR